MITIAFQSTDPGGKWYFPLPTIVYTQIQFPPRLDFNPIPLMPTVHPFSLWIPTYTLENNLHIFIGGIGAISGVPIPAPIVVADKFVDLVDDDTFPPYMLIVEPPDYQTVTPVIFDSDPYFAIKLWGFDIPSGIQSIIATLSYDGVTQYAFGFPDPQTWFTYWIFAFSIISSATSLRTRECSISGPASKYQLF